MAPSPSRPGNPPKSDLITRGVYKTNPLGTATFVGLRALDITLQHRLLLRGWGESLLSALHLASLPINAHPAPEYLTSPAAASRSLLLGDPASLAWRDAPLSRVLVLGMLAGGAVKQAVWATAVSREEMKPKAAVVVGVLEGVVNCVDSLMVLAAGTSGSLGWLGPRVGVPGWEGVSVPLATVVGMGLWVVGMGVEVVAEGQRRGFKGKSGNKGRVCDEGLWSVARHPNYGGYTLWRAGVGMVAGGWLGGVVMGGLQGALFVWESVPELGGYMEKRYGEGWREYVRKVKWVLIPGVY
ncbi:putative 7-dehydrocholesterol reductase [Podospora conica]|nr:putative 7-dehydrocholesterol reductase [Schizothecium conicum]